jgi:hypothetical protein
MVETLPAAVYLRVISLPFSNHEAAKQLIERAHEVSAADKQENKKVEIRAPKRVFTTKKKRTIRGLFKVCMQQSKMFCPADTIRVRFTKRDVVLIYQNNQKYYKGIDDI